jgi:hypothetical protein
MINDHGSRIFRSRGLHISIRCVGLGRGGVSGIRVRVGRG